MLTSAEFGNLNAVLLLSFVVRIVPVLDWIWTRTAGELHHGGRCFRLVNEVVVFIVRRTEEIGVVRLPVCE